MRSEMERQWSQASWGASRPSNSASACRRDINGASRRVQPPSVEVRRELCDGSRRLLGLIGVAARMFSHHGFRRLIRLLLTLT